MSARNSVPTIGFHSYDNISTKFTLSERMANLVRKFFILMWKNLLGKKRHWVGSILEIIIPAVLFAVLVVLRTEGGEDLNPKYYEAKDYETVLLPIQFCTSVIPKIIDGDSTKNFSLLYSPANDVKVDRIMNLVEGGVGSLLGLCGQFNPDISVTGAFSIQSVANADDFETIVSANGIESDNKDPIFGGVTFTISEKTGLDYTMRFSKDYTQPLTEFVYLPYTFDGPQDYLGEAYSLQTSFQALIDLAYIQDLTGETLIPGSIFDIARIKLVTGLKQMVYPAYLANNLALLLKFFMPFFLVLSFCFIVPPILKRIVQEKETGVKELMKMMGLPSWLHWFTWFLSSAMTTFISVFIITLLLHINFKEATGPVLNYSNPVLTFIFLYLYSMAVITELFALSTLFSRPNIALGIGVLFHIMSFTIPNNIINQTDDGYTSIPYGSKLLLSLFPNVNMNWGTMILLDLEGKGLGIKGDNLFEKSNKNDDMTMGMVWIMFLIDMLFYSILIWYIDNVRPGKYGVAKPFYFPFQPSTWCGTKRSTKVAVVKEIEADDVSMFEKEPELPAGIRVRGLRKEFPQFRKDPVVAVDKVSFSAYEGEITTLLGHNGAGKTTTMSVLTGLYSTSAGQATINGFNINTDMDRVRQNLGLCPQHNMLFEDLTVREHLVFFAMLKGLSKGAAEKEAKMYIEMLNLVPKKNINCSKLSGGMKRKVNLGIALIGGSKVVMLDEPTSGMDPEARRGMWDLLLSLKAERTILLTTHFMEEADVLGDRIAIMTKGKVTCYGTPFFLKRRFGSGYTLRVAKNLDADTNTIVNTVKGNVQGSELISESVEELQITFPTDQSKNLPEMFKALETKSSEFGIEHLGLDLTTMEDVFLKIGSMAHEEEVKNTGNGQSTGKFLKNGGINNGGYSNGDNGAWSNGEGLENQRKQSQRLLQGVPLFISQFRGLLEKRAIYTYRRPLLYIVMMLIPIGMALFNVLSLNTIQDARTVYKPRDITLEDYTETITLYQADQQSLNFGEMFASTISLGTSQKVDNVTEAILKEASGHENLAKYQDQYIIAADFSFSDNILPVSDIPFKAAGTIASGVFNSVPIHSKPLAQLHLSNAILKEYDTDATSKKKIRMTTHPLPDDNKNTFDRASAGQGTLLTFAYGTTWPIGLSVLVSSFVIFPLNERTTNAKQVQIMTGLNPILFWLCNLLWDNLLYLISSLTLMGLVTTLDSSDIFQDYGGAGAFVLIIMFLGFFGIPFSYVVSFFFNTAAGGFSFLLIFNVLSGSIAPLAVFLLRQFGEAEGGSEGLRIASDVVRWIFNWFPIFPFTRSLMAIITVQESNNKCEKKIDRETLNYVCEVFKKNPMLAFQQSDYAECCTAELVGDNAVCDVDLPGFETIPCHKIESFFTWDPLRGINTDLIVMAVDGILLFLILVMIEKKYIGRLLAWIRNEGKAASYDDPPLDDDVLDEQERSSRGNDPDIMRVINLQKVFGGDFRAVRGLSFGVKSGECFGLLGINGAGKTTSFRMLTGDEIPTTGVASLLGHYLDKQRSKFLQNIGYCPQFDSIIPELTGKELLTLMCRVRGVPSASTASEVERWTDFLEIQQYINRESGSYSGGNKRKLNVAMALVGEPPIVFLDEPSTGVDPVARRNMWSIIQRIQRNGQSVVLTSHSMEECEALCDRLGIMVNGQFQCFGTVNHLKNKFAQGFSLQIKLEVEELMARREYSAVTEMEENVISAVEAQFNSTKIKDRHMGYLQFSIEDPTIPLHVLFSKMEGIKNQTNVIEEYSIQETTLEQVFLSFARQQQTTL